MMMAGGMGGANYPAMMRMGPNGVGNPNDLKRAAAMNNHNPYVSCDSLYACH
jgi:hypothetical protein